MAQPVPSMEVACPAEAPAVKAITLLYHDVVPPGGEASSGFRGADADIYKLDEPAFEEHLQAIASSIGRAPARVFDLPAAYPTGPRGPWLLTVDDGGVGAIRAAESLDRRRWLAHFFITTDYIGTAGFLTADHIRDLRRRGHVIGTHSCSHPARMSRCTDGQLVAEWSQSLYALSEILGETVTAASIPGGYFSRRVAEAAERTGIRQLFTSEPTTRISTVGECTVLGRYMIKRSIPAATSGAIAAGAISPRLWQSSLWNAKKLAKAVGGDRWLRLRRYILSRRAGPAQSDPQQKPRSPGPETCSPGGHTERRNDEPRA
jgi:peptidoglycan/xylan/chitin deacetylase (PgdA/CDA1 family)